MKSDSSLVISLGSDADHHSHIAADQPFKQNRAPGSPSKGFDRLCNLCFLRLMRRSVALALLSIVSASPLLAEDPPPQATPQKRGHWFSRMFHPFQSTPAPNYNDARLRGLVLELKLSAQPVKLSEVRQLDVKITLSNVSKRAVTLDFPTEQRIEIYLKNSTETVLTNWSDNHAFEANAGSVLINPGERIYYAETIATRELTPNKVFIAEVFFPEYPELRTRQKFLTAP